jgi:hypothetical protein
MSEFIANKVLATYHAQMTQNSQTILMVERITDMEERFKKETEWLDKNPAPIDGAGITVHHSQQIYVLMQSLGWEGPLLPYIDWNYMKQEPADFNWLKLRVTLQKLYKMLNMPETQMVQNMAGIISGIGHISTIKGDVKKILDFLEAHGEAYYST